VLRARLIDWQLLPDANQNLCFLAAKLRVMQERLSTQLATGIKVVFDDDARHDVGIARTSATADANRHAQA